ncbi:hypothetical protein FSW04_01320 [Baekduia soli]|uniref:Uncharacterized protein n=1 Tax=Baekduia soli TaxID=496014 RepID=A0A5B8U044_9ACTN|nr:hypothetical protein [Baekduia soli]QEC46348.1 hypothetical protein FSW04_01320 [Baekduia soli]
MSRTMPAALLVSLIFLAGCGNATKTVTQTGANGQQTTATVPDVHFAKTKFVLHTGLAFGAFHRYIYTPYRAHQFSKSAPGRTKVMVKAGAAGLFAVHELKQANRAALSDDRLRPLAQKVDGLGGQLGELATSLKGGVLNPAAIAGAASSVDRLGSQSSSAGTVIKDLATPGLGG